MRYRPLHSRNEGGIGVPLCGCRANQDDRLTGLFADADAAARQGYFLGDLRNFRPCGSCIGKLDRKLCRNDFFAFQQNPRTGERLIVMVGVGLGYIVTDAI